MSADTQPGEPLPFCPACGNCTWEGPRCTTCSWDGVAYHDTALSPPAQPQEMWAVLYLHDWTDKGIWPEIHAVFADEKDALTEQRTRISPEKYFVRRARVLTAPNPPMQPQASSSPPGAQAPRPELALSVGEINVLRRPEKYGKALSPKGLDLLCDVALAAHANEAALEAERAAREEAAATAKRVIEDLINKGAAAERERDEAIVARDAADLAIQRIGMLLGTTDEWTDQGSMIADVERVVAEALAAKERAEEERDNARTDHERWEKAANVLQKSLITSAHLRIDAEAQVARLTSALAGARESIARMLETEAVACIKDVVIGDMPGTALAHARAGALLTAAADVRALPITEPVKAEGSEHG